MSFGEQLIAWRRELHQNPELSGQEVETTTRLRQWLTNAGITPQPYDLSTGLVAEIGSGNKLIALRADIDALPIEERSGVPFSSSVQAYACLRTRYPHQRDPRRRVKAERAGSVA
jgi:metal-dependent amidase/aminoacylase/carboxypeptidase family protein